MPTKRTRKTLPYPQSVGNLALADDSLSLLHTTTAKPRSPQVRLVQDRTEEKSEVETLAPITGMMNGIRLSLTLWSLIVIIYWIYGSL